MLIVSESEDDILKINDVLEKKRKKYMSRVDEIDEEYRELVPRIDDRIRKREEDIKDLLSEIVDIDREKNELMQAKFKELKGEP